LWVIELIFNDAKIQLMAQCMKINHPFPFGYYVEFFVAFLSGFAENAWYLKGFTRM